MYPLGTVCVCISVVGDTIHDIPNTRGGVSRHNKAVTHHSLPVPINAGVHKGLISDLRIRVCRSSKFLPVPEGDSSAFSGTQYTFGRNFRCLIDC